MISFDPGNVGFYGCRCLECSYTQEILFSFLAAFDVFCVCVKFCLQLFGGKTNDYIGCVLDLIVVFVDVYRRGREAYRCQQL